MRILLDDLLRLSAALPHFTPPLWVQEGHAMLWPFRVPMTQTPWLHGRYGVLHTSSFGYFRNVETGEKVYISALLSEAVSNEVRAAYAASRAKRRAAPPFTLWRKAWQQRQHLRQLAKHWQAFFPTVLSVWDSHSSVKAATQHIVRNWTQEEISLTAQVLQCRADPFFVAKTLLAIPRRDDLIPF